MTPCGWVEGGSGSLVIRERAVKCVYRHHVELTKVEVHTAVSIDESHPSQWGSHSLTSYTLRREEGSGHAATIELSPRQKLDVTNQIHALRKSDLLSWSTIMSRV